MTDFDDEFAAADAVLAEVFGETVEYWRGSDSNTDVSAEVTLVDHEIAEADGFVTVVRSFDFTIPRSQLTIDSAEVAPQQGDRFKRTINSQVHVFTVMRIVDRDCYEWQDPDMSVYVIHTKLTEIES